MSRILSLVLALGLLSGCATNQPSADAPPAPIETTTETYDPWERFNRGVYRFNARFDEAIHFPLARAYRRVVPHPVRTGVDHFFSNLGEVGNTVNHLLQGRLGRGARSAGRFLINSTVGLAGLFDVADKMGLARTPTSFGNTLGRWGMGAGPYLVLPVLGPSTLRDGLGVAADFGLDTGGDVGGLYSSDAALPLGTLYAVDVRSRLDFRYYQSGSPFEYELVRFLYTRKRAIEVGGIRHDAPASASAPALSEEASERDVAPVPAGPLQ